MIHLPTEYIQMLGVTPLTPPCPTHSSLRYFDIYTSDLSRRDQWPILSFNKDFLLDHLQRGEGVIQLEIWNDLLPALEVVILGERSALITF